MKLCVSMVSKKHLARTFFGGGHMALASGANHARNGGIRSVVLIYVGFDARVVR
jgi:hypothetical protein